MTISKMEHAKSRLETIREAPNQGASTPSKYPPKGARTNFPALKGKLEWRKRRHFQGEALWKWRCAKQPHSNRLLERFDGVNIFSGNETSASMDERPQGYQASRRN